MTDTSMLSNVEARCALFDAGLSGHAEVALERELGVAGEKPAGF